MEAVKTEEKKESKLIVVVGVEEIGKQFLKEAIVHILALSGYSVNAQDYDKPEDADFHVITADQFNIELEAKAVAVAGSYRNPVGVIEYELGIDPQNPAPTNINTMLDRFYELSKWLRTSKLIYVMDYDSPINSKGLHNYNNLNNLIMPMKYMFQGKQAMAGLKQPEEGRRYFNELDPKKLIEALVPDLAEKSRQASEKFEQVKKEKTENDGSEQ